MLCVRIWVKINTNHEKPYALLKKIQDKGLESVRLESKSWKIKKQIWSHMTTVICRGLYPPEPCTPPYFYVHLVGHVVQLITSTIWRAQYIRLNHSYILIGIINTFAPLHHVIFSICSSCSFQVGSWLCDKHNIQAHLLLWNSLWVYLK